MHSILFISAGVVAILAAAVIAARKWLDKPKKASKWEKAEIMKQLLARADEESGVSTIGSLPTGSHRVASVSSPLMSAKQKRAGRARSPESTLASQGKSRPAPFRSNPNDTEIEEQIRQRAYELYQQHGGVGGNAADDWAQAKKEVLRLKARAGSASS